MGDESKKRNGQKRRPNKSAKRAKRIAGGGKGWLPMTRLKPRGEKCGRRKPHLETGPKHTEGRKKREGKMKKRIGWGGGGALNGDAWETGKRRFRIQGGGRKKKKITEEIGTGKNDVCNAYKRKREAPRGRLKVNHVGV